MPGHPRERFALSVAQRALWARGRTAGGPEFTLRRAYRLRGRLDRAAAAGAVGAVVAAHEALRTRYGVAGGEPYQVAGEPPDDPPAWTDLSGVPDPEGRAARFAEEPFDLEAGPLFRARLIRLAAEDHVLLLTAHEGVADAWSMRLLERDLFAAWTGGPSAVPRPPARYGDVAAGECDRAAGLSEHLAYWRRHLAGAPAAPALPADRPRPPVPGHPAEAIPLTIPPGVLEELRAWDDGPGDGSGGHGGRDVLPRMVAVLAAFQVVLARRSGVEGVVVGVPVRGRPRPEQEGVVGPFADRVMLHGDLSGALSGDLAFADLVERVRDTVLDAGTYQDLPFETLLGALAPDDEPGRHPVAQVWFEVAAAGGPGLTGPAGLEVEPFPLAPVATRFDVELRLTTGGSGTLVYAADLFERPTVAGLAGDLLALLAEVAGNPRARVAGVGASGGALRPAPGGAPGRDGPRASEAGPGTAAEPDGETGSDTEAGRAESERIVAEIWREALCVDRVGRHDDFFALGGHSRLAIKVAERLRDAFHRDLPLRTLFDHRTVAELAAVITARS
ncbi:hypothetical protein GCM10017673_28520 [Streptosporangium violaceochromogenes]|nr:hypothetical protein GCM10017673_28520 [Streptosporangium violaceochromogenes]